MAELKVVSYNVNGIRSALKKGLADWLKSFSPDVVCFQEMKVHIDDFDPKPFEDLGYHSNLFGAEKKGYSGVAIMSKVKPDNVVNGFDIKHYDIEGRAVRVDIGDLSILNTYFPSGTSGDERQAFKIQFLDEFFDYIQKLQKKRPKILIAGDYNIANKEIDIWNPVSNKNTSGFKPEERAWMDKYFSSGFIDTFRYFHKEPDRYSWWTARFPSVRAQNKGWRIDYIAATKNLEKSLIESDMFPDVKQSDHCPVYCKLKI
jgi:exodeoxyribonuclease III